MGVGGAGEAQANDSETVGAFDVHAIRFGDSSLKMCLQETRRLHC